MAKILVAGSLNMDLRFSMKRMPLEGETVLADGLLYNPGGKGANQAAAAAKLGGDVAMLGAVGRDGFGDVLSRSLEDCGCGVSALRRVTAPTGTASIYVDEQGRNSIVVIAGANAYCDATEGSNAHISDGMRMSYRHFRKAGVPVDFVRACDLEKNPLGVRLLILIAALLTGCIGLALIFRPADAALAITAMLGIALLLDGIMSLITVLTTVKIIRNQQPDVVEVKYREIM